MSAYPRRVLVTLLALLAVGQTRATSAATQPACRVRLAQLKATVRHLESRPVASVALPATPGLEPPRGTRGAEVKAPVLIVEYALDGTRVDGQTLQGGLSEEERRAGITAAAERAASTWKLLHPRDPAPAKQSVAVLFDRRVSARAALDFLTALGDKYALSLIALGDTIPLPPRQFPSRVTEALAKIVGTKDFQEKLALRSELFGKAIAGCAGHEKYFQELGSEQDDIAKRERRLHQAIIKALVSCSCGEADVEMIEATMLQSADLSPLAHQLPLRLNVGANSTIDLSTAATVQDLVARFPAKAGPVAVRWTSTAGSSRTSATTEEAASPH